MQARIILCIEVDSTYSIFPLVFFLLISFHNFCILTSKIIKRIDAVGVCGKVLVAGWTWMAPVARAVGLPCAGNFQLAS